MEINDGRDGILTGHFVEQVEGIVKLEVTITTTSQRSLRQMGWWNSLGGTSGLTVDFKKIEVANSAENRRRFAATQLIVPLPALLFFLSLKDLSVGSARDEQDRVNLTGKRLAEVDLSK